MYDVAVVGGTDGSGVADGAGEGTCVGNADGNGVEGAEEGTCVGNADGSGVADGTGVVVGAVVGADVDPQTVSESPAPPLASSVPRSFTMVHETSDGQPPLLLTEMV